MSSHYIYVKCKKCALTEMVYTGDKYLDYFDNDWEESTITSLCIKCKKEVIKQGGSDE